ncbi:MAG TPA: hypothetical protein VFO58_04335 [Vicinamibacterales bacterium]|nr:hypothetical protein [Vicinamibacterales bacterium]
MLRRLLFAVVGIALATATAWVQAPQEAPAAPGAGARGGGRGRAAGPPPRIMTFEAHPASITLGESVLLVWSTENPAAPAIEPDLGPVLPRGSRRLTPGATTTYTLTMRGPNDTVVTRSVTVTVAGTAFVSVGSAATPPASGPIPRTPDGKPDFSGVYAFGGGGRGRGAGAPADGIARTPTLKPGAEQYRVARGSLDVGRTADCMPLSPPDAFGVPYQFQIVQNKDLLVILHEYPGTFRLVPLDGEPHQVDPDPSWLGDSVGRWEGDVLVVDTIGYNDKTQVSGFRHSEALHTVERFRRIEGGFEYDVTIEDPNVFVGPWTETRTYRLNVPPMKKIMEFVCENNRDYRPLFGPQSTQPAQPGR